MATYLKRALVSRAAHAVLPEVRERVGELLESLERGRESEAIRLAEHFDGWMGPIVHDRDLLHRIASDVDGQVRRDIEYAHQQVRRFALAQRRSLAEFEMEISDGVVAGQRLVPVQTAGCYVPAGRFAHIASAIMSITTARAAGVDRVIVATPATAKRAGIHPAIGAAALVAGADTVLALGGVQGIGALAFGLFTGEEADVVVGPGNSYVAEAKRQLFGRVGIDVIAGPTESLVIADADADPVLVATDLVGQAEHGADSPVWLVSLDRDLAEAVSHLVPQLIKALPEPSRAQAEAAWSEHGEIVVAEDRAEAVQLADAYAPEHLQVLAADPDWWLRQLRNYGSLFLGEQTNVTYGDKCSGPNHILPTGRAARHSGGMSVSAFIKTVTHQRMTEGASVRVGQVAARISRYEGMEGHARSADVRLMKYAPTSAPSRRQQGLPYLDLDLTEQEPIPDEAIGRANELMRSGRLFRYGEAEAGEADAACLEEEFAALVGRPYCVAFNSCGASMAVALKAAGVERDEPVLMNAFTLAPVPGAIVHAGAEPVFVGIKSDYTIDLDDLRAAAERRNARWLLLSYMRGHIGDMTATMALCDELGVAVIEDCAHTMGASWAGRPTGTFGLAACFSTQSFKHVNSGEGGLLVTDDDDLAARAVLLSGSYMLYEQHGARPDAPVFERHRLTTPNLSMRMSALAAALVRPQLGHLADRAHRWNERYRRLAALLDADARITIPTRPPEENYVASSIQFSVVSAAMREWIEVAGRHGVHVKWFGRESPIGFTSRFEHWRYAPEQSLDRTAQVLAGLCDLRIPLAMTERHAEDIAAVIRGALDIAGSAESADTEGATR